MIETIVFVVLLLILAPLLGRWLMFIFEGKPTYLYPVFGPVERGIYRLAGIDPFEEMDWKKYLKALLLFNLIGFLVLFFILIFQGFLPLNPQHFPGIPLDLAFNTAASFVTNTNWQAYAGETTLSYASQMFGLTVQNFLSAATGFCTLLVFNRGIIRKTGQTIGNFWADLIRSILYVLLPLSFIFAIFLMGEGVIQTFAPYQTITTLEGYEQTIPLGPVASQEAIKQLGSNGGGFFNANSAHPFENPTPLTNFFETLAIVLLPAALVLMYGEESKVKRHGWLLLLVMLFFWLVGLSLAAFSSTVHNPILPASPVLEGIETRFGMKETLLWTVSTTGTSNGSVNSMLDSLPPLIGGIALFNMMLGELIFGGVGTGLCSMLMFVLLTVFLAGLMVGRTPEYRGKKIERKEILLVMIAALVPAACISLGSGGALALPKALESVNAKGPHGLTEMVYAFTSTAVNNGSSFAGMKANTPFFNLLLGTIMIICRLAIIIPSLAIAGSLVLKKVTPVSRGTFSTESLLFAILLIGVIFIFGALTYFPALCLGPLMEHLLMLRGGV